MQLQIAIRTWGPSQKGAYQDSASGSEITLSEPLPAYLGQEGQRRYIVGLAKAASGELDRVADRKEDSGGLHPYISEVKQLSPTKWAVQLVHPFLD